MYLVPDKLNQVTGNLILKDGQELGVRTLCYINKTSKRKLWQVTSMIYCLDYKTVPETEQVVDNLPQKYELIHFIDSYKRPSWIVRYGDNLVTIDQQSFAEAVLAGMNGTEFNCRFVWIYDGGKMRLVGENLATHTKALEESKIRKLRPIKKKDLEFGGVYQNLNGYVSLYLGKLQYYNNVWRNGSYRDEIQESEIFINLNHPTYKIKSNNQYSLSDINNCSYNTTFLPRLKLQQLNITLDDVKNHIKTNNSSFLRLV